MIAERTFSLSSNQQAQWVSGESDSHLRLIEELLEIDIVPRGMELKLLGPAPRVDKALQVLNNLAALGNHITEHDVQYAAELVLSGESVALKDIRADIIVTTARGKQIRPKTLGQQRYVASVHANSITFGIGPAGTGKTYLAMAAAVAALKRKKVDRIVLTRPAVEAGEHLGFLPGDLQNKVDPYLRPIYDALFEILGQESYQKLMEKRVIEIAPLAYMRGRTLDDAFILLDEAQNTTPAQMKMFLTRLGFGSKAVVTGDITQVDLPRGKVSGLIKIQPILKGISGIGFSYLTKADVVRHPLVQKIVEAYDKYQERQGSN